MVVRGFKCLRVQGSFSALRTQCLRLHGFSDVRWDFDCFTAWEVLQRVLKFPVGH